MSNCFDELHEYIDYFSDLIELERKEEMEKHRREIKEMNPKEREEKGRALLNLGFNEEKKGLGGNIVLKFSRNYSFPDNEISVGDLVMISRNEPLNSNNPTGTVTEITNYSISISFDNKPHGFVFGNNLRIDLYVNDVTFQRMLDALKSLKNPDDDLRFLRNIILAKENPTIEEDESLNFCNQNLNQSQRNAVSKAVGSTGIFLIHGPPGTGKTTTLIEVIEQHIENGESVLATADSNIAVDNLVDFLVDRGRSVVRVGHPARVNKSLKEYTLDYLVQEKEEYKKSQRLWDEVSRLDNEQEKHTFPSGRWRRGLSDKAIKDLAKKNKGSRGIPPKKIKSMSKWLDIQEKINNKVEKAKKLEDKAINKILNQVDVICATNSTSGSELLNKKDFDVVVIDEATQATEPSCLIPITLGSKVIMAGDHKQLPPTILNQEAKKRGLNETLFERLLGLHGDYIKSFLDIQYRMNKKIMNFPNKEFYDNNLTAADSVKNHVIDNLLIENEFKSGSEAIVFYDTLGRFKEKTRKGSTSKINPGEANIVIELVNNALNSDLDPEAIGLISPYDDQIDLLNKKLDKENLEIETVDGFQGREKELIILSLVRSNKNNELGFLKDYRRLNVSLTRARRKLIIIGDSKTLGSDNKYSKLMNYIEDTGKKYEAK